MHILFSPLSDPSTTFVRLRGMSASEQVGGRAGWPVWTLSRMSASGQSANGNYPPKSVFSRRPLTAPELRRMRNLGRWRKQTSAPRA